MNLHFRPVRSSLGRKYFMALTGLVLTGFVLGHMAGNLLIFAGRDALNSYAAALKDKPALLWPARLGLLVVFVLHVYLGLRLAWENQMARPIGYVYERTLRASWASRHMVLTGLALLVFILYHLAHFTFGAVKGADVWAIEKTEAGTLVVVQKPKVNYLKLHEERTNALEKFHPDQFLDQGQAQAELERRQAQTGPTEAGPPPQKRHDVYTMAIAGFRNPFITIGYLLAMVFLALHLWHGGSSWWQSLGLDHPRYRWFTWRVGPVLAVIVLVGNCSMPLAVLTGLVK
jgi:succinate dehydrogenase / fumarate reductase cytochrome b subunit